MNNVIPVRSEDFENCIRRHLPRSNRTQIVLKGHLLMQVLFNELPRQPSIAIKDPFKWRTQAFLENARRHHADRATQWLAREGTPDRTAPEQSASNALDARRVVERSSGLTVPIPIARSRGAMHKNVAHNKSLSQIQNAGLNFLRGEVPKGRHLCCNSVSKPVASSIRPVFGFARRRGLSTIYWPRTHSRFSRKCSKQRCPLDRAPRPSLARFAPAYGI